MAGIPFVTRKALQRHAWEIFYLAEKRRAVAPWLDGTDLEFVKALLERHPDARRLIGAGVKGIWVGASATGQVSYFLQRLDGTTAGFDYQDCVAKLKVQDPPPSSVSPT